MSVALQEFLIVAAAIVFGQWLFYKIVNQPKPLEVSTAQPEVMRQLSGDAVRDWMDTHYPD